MKISLERQIYLVFIVALVLLSILGWLAYRSTTSLAEAVELEKHTLEVLLNLDETLALTVDAETGGRGFVITGNESFLEPYTQTKQRIEGSLAQLRGLTADNPAQREKLDKVEDLINRKLLFIRRVVETRREQDFNSAVEITNSGQGRTLMIEIRRLIGEMKEAERSLLRERETVLDGRIKGTYRILLLGSIAGIISLCLANFAVYREISKRRTAESSLRDANKGLEKRVAERTSEISDKNKQLQEQIEKREQSEDRRRLALEAGRLGTWKLNLDRDDGEMDERSLAIFGLTKEDFNGSSKLAFSRIVEEDAPLVDEAFRKSITEQTNFDAEFRIKADDGTIRWNNCTGQPQFDENGEITHLVGFCRDITTNKEIERESEELLKRERAARKDAEIANRLRDEFLATVSHELRAPLNSILGWARMMEKGQLDEPTSAKAINTIVRNAESQNRLIEDLLDVSRIISGKLRLEVMTIKPINIVESALETVRPAAEAKGIRIAITGDGDISHISGDPNRLQQVVWNLLSNAIKFTPPEGEVRLEIERTDDFVEIRVKDTGVGIKEEFLPHVFDRFSQADASSIRKFGGLGLGLAIVRHITEMHGGTVHAESAGENRGSTFIVRLPLIVQTDEESAAAENRRKAQTLEGAPEFNLDGMLILVVDDEEDTRQLLVQTLTFYGATVTTANSAEQAFTELQDKNPDVLVSDIGMPDEDGYSLIRRIRALPDERHKNIPAVALTAFTRAQDRMRALTSGYQNHVSKPVEPDELATVIASLTGRLQLSEAD